MARLPSLAALRGVEAVARTGGFTRAAAELGVTQVAVSRQVARLERDLAVSLFERTPRGAVPTEAGARLQAALRGAFRDIEQALEAISTGGRQVLTVSVAPYFSARWLTPRLPRFLSRHPGVEVSLHHAYLPPDYRRDRIDLGINWGTGDWPDATAERVLKGDLTPVMSRALAERSPPARPADLARHTLLHEFEAAHWRAWFKAAGRAMPEHARLIRIDDTHALRRAILDGQGVGLLFEGMLEEDLAAGQLIRPFPISAEVGESYWLTTPKGREPPHKARLFRAWLRQEIAREPTC